MALNLTFWGEFILSWLIFWWLYIGILVMGIIALIGSDKFVKVISVLLIIAVLISNMIFFHGYYILVFIYIYIIYIIGFMIGIALLLLANDNKLIELIGIVITIISMGFVIVNDFSVLNPSISLITIGVVLLIANKQIRKK